MKLYNQKSVIAGLVIFALLALLPIWYNLGARTAGKKIKLAPPKAGQHHNCMLPVEEMRSSHMDLLNDWRDRVVRNGERYTEVKGVKYEMSLTKTCLDCHDSKKGFCDECHNYMGVKPYCWDCHVDPTGD